MWTFQASEFIGTVKGSSAVTGTLSSSADTFSSIKSNTGVVLKCLHYLKIKKLQECNITFHLDTDKVYILQLLLGSLVPGMSIVATG